MDTTEKVNNFVQFAEAIKSNTIFVLEFLGIIVGIMLFAFVLEKILKVNKKSDKILSTRKIAVIGVFAAIAGILMSVEIPIPLIPTTHKFEFGDLPAMICGFAFGPVAAVLVEFIKVFIKSLIRPTQTAFVGELANFIIGCSYVLPATVFYWIKKSKKNALISCIIGAASMVIVGALINQFYIIPTFAKMYCGGDINKVLGMGAAVNPLIDSVTMYVLFAAVPINLLKSVSVSALVMWLYKPLSLVWKKK